MSLVQDRILRFIMTPDRKSIFAVVEQLQGQFTINDIFERLREQEKVITHSTVQKTLQGLTYHRYLIQVKTKSGHGRGRPTVVFEKNKLK